jgi:cellulose synthase/poly-beta-1,6-N-acetylglucosamine synthase-like glycosyltransferase
MPGAIVDLYVVVQVAFLACLLICLWFYSRHVDVVDGHLEGGPQRGPDGAERPEIIVVYPVLDELEATMRTSMLGFDRADYPDGKRRVVAIPNADDVETIKSLEQIQLDHPFLEILPIPPTSDPSWAPVWEAWNQNAKAYWWHAGKRSHSQALPPKKTRQLTYALYAMAAEHPDALLSYIDADSVVPPDYFTQAAAGIHQFEVLQNTNVAGNALATVASSCFAMDHMLWDGAMYQHMSAKGKQPYYVLGKGLFIRIRDLLELGGFNPWLTIEDPEIGMRLWANGRRLGIIRSPLIEEVPMTFSAGITQRKRWVAGFFQSLGAPLTLMGMTPRQRFRARLNLVPCLSLILNPVGFAVGIWALVAALTSSTEVLSTPVIALSVATIALTLVVLAIGQRAAFRQTALIFDTKRERALFLLRANPLALLVYWIWWSIPLAIGFGMYLTDRGQRWERTPKIDANHDLIRAEGEEHEAASIAVIEHR